MVSSLVVASILFSCLFLARAHPVQEKPLTVTNNVYPRGSSQSTLKAAPPRVPTTPQLPIEISEYSEPLSTKEVEDVHKLRTLQIYSVISSSTSKQYPIASHSVKMFELDFTTTWHDPATGEATPAIARIHTTLFPIAHEKEGYKRAGLLLDFGRDDSNHKRWWIIMKDMTVITRMNGHPAMLLHEILSLDGPWSLANCTGRVEAAMAVLKHQLKTDVTEKKILPSFPHPLEVLFTFDREILLARTATVISWSAWNTVLVWDENDRVIASALAYARRAFSSVCTDYVNYT